MENKNSIIRKYNYNLETGTVGTDDENIANILFNTNKMEKRVSFATSNLEELKKALGELFFLITDSKVHLFDFLEIFESKTNADTVKIVTFSIDEAIKKSKTATRESCSVEPDITKICEVFSEVYNIFLKNIPHVLALDNQAIGRL